ncbi:MAG: hypothetical protein JWN21_1368 [Sphingomonas bacterium]|nr:hypothetical protein [Sphingomonas bacterium]
MRSETGFEELELALAGAQSRLSNGMAVWEATRAVARIIRRPLDDALGEVQRFCALLDIDIVPIGAAEAEEAVSAQLRYGKGSGHPARLNMGDCFAYACAKTNKARLLYKGDDFVHTDLA